MHSNLWVTLSAHVPYVPTDDVTLAAGFGSGSPSNSLQPCRAGLTASSHPPAHEIISHRHTGCLTLPYVRYDVIRYAPQWVEPNIIILSAYPANFHNRSQILCTWLPNVQLSSPDSSCLIGNLSVSKYYYLCLSCQFSRSLTNTMYMVALSAAFLS